MTIAFHQRPFTGRHMAIVMIAFFAVVFAANGTLFFFAKQSWTGLVVQNAYVASQNFNEETERLVKFQAMGIVPDLSYAGGKLRLQFSSTKGEDFAVKSVRAKLGRPSDDGDDQLFTFSEDAPGVFAAPAKLGEGQWFADVSAEVNGERNWKTSVRLIVEGQ